MKLKAISHDPVRFAENALGVGDEVVTQLVSMYQEEAKNGLQAFFDAHSKTAQAGDQRADPNHIPISQARTTSPVVYFLEGVQIRMAMREIIPTGLEGLFSSDNKTVDDFEVCMLNYETGLDRALIVLYSDRDGSFLTSPSPVHVKFSYAVVLMGGIAIPFTVKTRIEGVEDFCQLSSCSHDTVVVCTKFFVCIR